MAMNKGRDAVIVFQTLTEKNFTAAYRAVRICASPLHRRGVRGGLCLTAAALAASVVPAYYHTYFSAWIPCCLIAAFLIAAGAFWFLQPAAETHRAGKLFRSCPLMALPCEIHAEYDRVTVKSERERYTEYWTDFLLCVETPELFAAAGGRERSLLVLPKSGLTEEQTDRLRALLSEAFAGRYHKTAR